MATDHVVVWHLVVFRHKWVGGGEYMGLSIILVLWVHVLTGPQPSHSSVTHELSTLEFVARVVAGVLISIGRTTPGL